MDGQYAENSSSSSSANTQNTQNYAPSSNNSSQETEKEGCASRLGVCLGTLLVIGLLNAVVGGLLWLIFVVKLGS